MFWDTFLYVATVLPFIATAASFLYLLLSTYRLKSKLNAQKRLADELASRELELQKLLSIIGGKSATVSEDEVAAAVDTLTQLVVALPTNDQRQIVEGLYQRSPLGQWNYVRRICRKAQSMRSKQTMAAA